MIDRLATAVFILCGVAITALGIALASIPALVKAGWVGYLVCVPPGAAFIFAGPLIAAMGVRLVKETR